jgi:hypothetical protein
VDFQKKRASFILSFFLIFCLAVSVVPQTVLAESGNPSDNLYEKIITDENGRQIIMVKIPTLPPQEVERIKAAYADALETDVPEVHTLAGVTNILDNVPAFTWCYGCSPTSAAMLFGYYDRTGYSNMYTGPTNGGVCPLYNSIWGYTSWPSVTCGECPLSATHKGIDGRTINGHVDDYWVDYNCTGPDPYVTNGWVEHTPDCLADYMGTSQAKYGLEDGATWFPQDYSGDRYYDSPFGCRGMRLFAESRGYTVVTNFNQLIKGGSWVTDPNKGFTFADFQAEIDAGRPVLLSVYNPEEYSAHSMLGYGYDTSTNTIYFHDTWDHFCHTMTWNGTYHGYQLEGVTVFQLEPPPEEGVTCEIVPSTYAKIPFAIVQSGFTLVGELMDLTSFSGMPSWWSSWWNSAIPDAIGSWISGPLSWSVDMMIAGLGLVNDVVGVLTTAGIIPSSMSWLGDLLDTVVTDLGKCYNPTTCNNVSNAYRYCS